MNFLAHFVIAQRFLPLESSMPFFVVGTALPDLLPLAINRVRLRPAVVERQPPRSAVTSSLQSGVLVHLATDTAFHKTRAFAESQSAVSSLFEQATFEGIRVRRFFLAHVLVELALDAVLVRANSGVADRFYEAFACAESAAVTEWTETVVSRDLPDLPAVLTRFAQSRYLYHYGQDEGVATGLSRLCARARQDTFEGGNYVRLLEIVRQTVELLAVQAQGLLEETAAAVKL